MNRTTPLFITRLIGSPSGAASIGGQNNNFFVLYHLLRSVWKEEKMIVHTRHPSAWHLIITYKQISNRISISLCFLENGNSCRLLQARSRPDPCQWQAIGPDRTEGAAIQAAGTSSVARQGKCSACLKLQNLPNFEWWSQILSRNWVSYEII